MQEAYIVAYFQDRVHVMRVDDSGHPEFFGQAMYQLVYHDGCFWVQP